MEQGLLQAQMLCAPPCKEQSVSLLSQSKSNLLMSPSNLVPLTVEWHSVRRHGSSRAEHRWMPEQQVGSMCRFRSRRGAMPRWEQ